MKRDGIFKVGEKVVVTTSIKLSQAGEWKIWPSYEIWMNNQKKQGPYEWHACNLTVEKAIQDSDQDGIPDSEDNRPYEPNKDQIDSDKDGIGDVCDNCPNVYNPDQMDMNQNGVGDACEVKDALVEKRLSFRI